MNGVAGYRRTRQLLQEPVAVLTDSEWCGRIQTDQGATAGADTVVDGSDSGHILEPDTTNEVRQIPQLIVEMFAEYAHKRNRYGVMRFPLFTICFEHIRYD